MLGKANTRKIDKYEYSIKPTDTSFNSTKNGTYMLQQNNLDSLTPVVVTDGGGVHII